MVDSARFVLALFSKTCFGFAEKINFSFLNRETYMGLPVSEVLKWFIGKPALTKDRLDRLYDDALNSNGLKELIFAYILFIFVGIGFPGFISLILLILKNWILVYLGIKIFIVLITACILCSLLMGPILWVFLMRRIKIVNESAIELYARKACALRLFIDKIKSGKSVE